MANTREETILLRLEADKAAAERAKGEIAAIKQSVKSLETNLQGSATTAARLGAELNRVERAKAINKIAEDARKARAHTKDWAAELDNVANKLAKIGASDSEIQGVANSIGTQGRRRISPFLASAGVTLRNQPAIATPLGVSTDAIAKLTALFGNLPPVALPVLGIFAALGVAFVALESQTAGYKKTLDSLTAANKAYYELLAEGAGSSEARKRVEELNNTLRRQREELALIENAFRKATEDANVFQKAAASLLSADDELTNRADTLRVSIRNNSTEAERLTAALNEGAFAENDYAKAIEETNRIRQEAALAGADDTLKLMQKMFREREMTSGQLDTALTNAINERASIEAALNKLKSDKAGGVIGEDIDKQITEFEVQIARLGGDIERMNALFADRKGTEEAIRVRKESIDAVEQYNADLLRLEEQAGQARVAAADKYLDSITKASEAAAEAARDALRKLQERRAELGLDLSRDEEDAGIDAERDRLDAQIELQREEAEAYEDHHENLKKIVRDSLLDQQNAIQNRDAVALFAAKQATAEKVEEENSQFIDEQKKRQKHYQEQLQDLGKAQRREREDRLRKYARDLADAQATYNRELQLSQAKYQRDIQLAQQQYNRELQLAQQKYSTELAARRTAIINELDLIRNGSQNAYEIQRQFWQQVQDLYAEGRQAQGAVGVPLNQIGNILSFDTGGLITRDGIYKGHKDEIVLNRRQQQAMGGFTFSPTINGMGMNRRQIVKVVEGQLHQFLNEAGVA